MLEVPFFVDRRSESRRLAKALRVRRSLMICGPAGIGKTALMTSLIAQLPVTLSERCLVLQGARNLGDLLRQLLLCLYQTGDANLRRQIHSEGGPRLGFASRIKGLSASRMKGALYRTLEGGDYRVFLDHFPPLTPAMARVVKEISWMRNTPVYWLVRDDREQRLGELCRFFYWGDEERLALPPLPARAAAELLESCIDRLGLHRWDLAGFREETLALSGGIPGAIVKMCTLAAAARYQHGSRIKIKSVYIDYVMSGQGLRGNAPRGLRQSKEDGLD